MTTHPLDILIYECGIYIKPLGFMYRPDRSTVSDYEEQIRVTKTKRGYKITEGIFRLDDDEPGDHSLWIPSKVHHMSSIESVEVFLDSHKSIY